MKECPKCKELIDDDALFCPNCGTKIGNTKTCINCGNEIEADSAFCPHCGASQIEETNDESEVTEAPNNLDTEASRPSSESIDTFSVAKNQDNKRNNSFDKIALGLLSLFLIVVLTILFFSLRENNQPNEPNDILNNTEKDILTDNLEMNKKPENLLETRINEIFSEGLKIGDPAIVANKFFSQEYRELYNKVDAIDSTGYGIGFWNGSIWDGRQDSEAERIEIERIYNENSQSADADICLINELEFNYRLTKTFHFVFENGNWFLDDNETKDAMKEYIEHLSEVPITLKECPKETERVKVNFFEDEGDRQIIEIFKDGELIQKMEGGAGEFAYPVYDKEMIHFVDANFDGEEDIFVGIGGDRTQNTLLLWNPQTQLYERYEEHLSIPTFSPLRKRIYQSGSVSAFEGFYSESYWQDGKLVEFELLRVIYDLEGFDFESQKKYDSYQLSKKFSIIDSGSQLIVQESDNISGLSYAWQIVLDKYAHLFGKE